MLAGRVAKLLDLGGRHDGPAVLLDEVHEDD